MNWQMIGDFIVYVAFPIIALALTWWMICFSDKHE